MKDKGMAPNFVPHLIDLSPDTMQEPNPTSAGANGPQKTFSLPLIPRGVEADCDCATEGTAVCIHDPRKKS
jgi:hypothetical protein